VILVKQHQNQFIHVAWCSLMDLCFSVDGYVLERTNEIGYTLECTKQSVLRSVDDHEKEGSEFWIDILLSFVTAALDDPKNEILILRRSDGRRAGMLWMCRSKDQYTCDDTGYIMGIFVEPELRGNGLGRALLKTAEDWCSEKGLMSVTLNVSPLNDALGLYEKCGFRERSVVMRKDLPGSRGSFL